MGVKGVSVNPLNTLVGMTGGRLLWQPSDWLAIFVIFVLLLSENKYDDDDDDLCITLTVTLLTVRRIRLQCCDAVDSISGSMMQNIAEAGNSYIKSWSSVVWHSSSNIGIQTPCGLGSVVEYAHLVSWPSVVSGD